MSDFCSTCSGESIYEEYDAFSRNLDKYQNCESGSWEWYTSQSFAPLVNDEKKRVEFFRGVLGFNDIPACQQVSWSVMICEGCSRSGSLICPVDNAGYCIDPNCDKHGELNRLKGWYEIGGDIKTLGEYRNKCWDVKL